MPNNYNRSAKDPNAAATVSLLVDGDNVNRDNLYKEASPGGTSKGTIALALDELAFVRRQRGATVKLSDADHTIDVGQGYVFACAVPGGARTITLRDPGIGGTVQPIDGEWEVVISRPGSGAHDISVVANGGTLAIATLPSATRSTVKVQYQDLNDGLGPNWRVSGGFAFTAGLNA